MMKTIAYLMVGSLLVLADTYAEAQSEAQQTPPPPANCTEPEYRQLDFWVGVWDLEWDLPNGKTGTGTNIISKSPYGDCVITENFDGSPTMKFKGMSVSTWHKPAKLWRQTWVDDQGGYFALSGGPNADGTFTLTNTRLSDKAPHSRMVWSEIKPDSLIWSWQGYMAGQGHKADGIAEDKKWKDQWVIRYTRKK
jgi:hypothetical protein